MPINLEKKKPISLAKESPGLQLIRAGLGWDESVINGTKADCDVSVFLLGADGKLPSEEFFVFYNNLRSPDGAVVHQGDSRDGEGDGDDESITLDLKKLSPSVEFIYFTVTIHESEERGHHFGNVKNSYIKLYNGSNNAVICSYDLAESYDGYDSLLIATLSRSGDTWEVEAKGQPFGGGLGALVELYQ